MKIALIGHGRMGKEIERLASGRNMKVAAVFTRASNSSGQGLTAETLAGVDVCIDFSSPESVVDNIRAVATTGIAMVVGTTGWNDRVPEVRELVERHGIGFFYASNFSIGVSLMVQLVLQASRFLNRYPEYDVSLNETHHQAKKDSPSGTALTLASAVLSELQRKKSMITGDASDAGDPQMLRISSARVGSVPGIHQVRFDSPFDSLEIVHTAHGRQGFANGALMAAEWLRGRRGFFSMEDMLKG